MISDLAVEFRVGVTEAERARAQHLLLTVEMEQDFCAAAARDDLEQTIDYYAVCQRLLGYGEGRSWKLIETLAVDIASLVRADFGAARVAVTVKKFVIRQAAYVAVRVQR